MTIETRDTPIRRRPDGSIDTDHYLDVARSARAARQLGAFTAIRRTLAGWRRRAAAV